MLLAACGGGTDPAASPNAASPGTDTTVLQGEPAVQTTAPASDRTEESVAQADRPDPDPSRELAPDFTLALADGSTFVLSEEARPVFMVFWAEW